VAKAKNVSSIPHLLSMPPSSSSYLPAGSMALFNPHGSDGAIGLNDSRNKQSTSGIRKPTQFK